MQCDIIISVIGMKSYKTAKITSRLLRDIKNLLITAVVLAAAWILCTLIKRINSSDVYVPMIFVLAVLIVSLLTDGYACGVIASVVSVIGVNWAFTYPYMKLDFSIYGYPTTFITMLAVSIVISTLATRAQEQEKLRHETEQAKLRANLLRAVSHDLRTPLTSIIGSISTVIDEHDNIPPEQQLTLLCDARQDAEWLVRMVENLLSITRISGTEDTHIAKSPEMLEEIIGECIANFRKRNPGATLDVSVPDQPVTVCVDAMLIEQVIMNLLDNAVYHAVGMSEISITVTTDSEYAYVDVADDGEGIDPAILEDIFKGQLGPSKSQPVDSDKFRGIGLAVCNAIISAHGGSITASNKREGGALFRFTLPLEETKDEHKR